MTPHRALFLCRISPNPITTPTEMYFIVRIVRWIPTNQQTFGSVILIILAYAQYMLYMIIVNTCLLQEDLMQKHQLIRNKYTLNYLSTFIKLIHIFQKTFIINEGFVRSLNTLCMTFAMTFIDHY